jgi:hypothetical protein
MRQLMRTLVIVLIGICLSATLVKAADDTSPVIGSWPLNMRSQLIYLFMLKKNGLSVRVSPDQFCRDFGYGEAVKSSDTNQKGYWDADQTATDGKTPGTLNWVICEFPKAH